VKASGIPIPFCAFNGGHDVFLDVGNKALGIRALQTRLGVHPRDTVHAGDRFTRTGACRWGMEEAGVGTVGAHVCPAMQHNAQATIGVRERSPTRCGWTLLPRRSTC